MIFKNRTINLSKPVEVYRNLTKKCYSVRQNGLIILHTNEILLKSASFRVQESGRQKVIKSKTKNVHAYIKGYLLPETGKVNIHTDLKIKYNPYLNSYFMLENSPITYCEYIYLNSNGVFYATRNS